MGSAPQPAPDKPVRREILVADFDPVAMRAPFYLRCGAAAFDYMLIVIWPVLGLVLGRLLGIDGTKLLSGELNNISWLIAILVGLSNLILLPIATGRSLGKMIAGLRIVAHDGADPAAKSVLLRQTLGYLLTAASFGIGFLFAAFNIKGRALHDYMAGSQVVFGRTTVRSRS